MSHILLVGFMGAGKSTVGRIVASRLGVPFVDLDTRIEALAGGVAVRSIFETQGEAAFRALESNALHDLVSESSAVVACGGGVVLDDGNRRILKGLGRVVYLKVDAAEALARIGDTDSRPLLSHGDAAAMATTLLAARETLYSSTADAVVDTAGLRPQEVAGRVIDRLHEAGPSTHGAAVGLTGGTDG